MVIWFLLMMNKIGIFKKAATNYLVSRHTQNACDKVFIILKQHFHDKNVYTKRKFNRNLNQNDRVEDVEITSELFYDFDNVLDLFYKQPESGSVTCTYIFQINAEQPGILELQDCSNSDI